MRKLFIFLEGFELGFIIVAILIITTGLKIAKLLFLSYVISVMLIPVIRR